MPGGQGLRGGRSVSKHICPVKNAPQGLGRDLSGSPDRIPDEDSGLLDVHQPFWHATPMRRPAPAVADRPH